MNFRDRFDAFDFALFGLGVLGLVLFVWLLPSHHPDAAATYAFGREAAIEESRAYLDREGFTTTDLVPLARLGQARRLLDSLQRDVGRTEAIRLLKNGGTERLPAFFWEVQWQRTDGQAMPIPGSSDARLAFQVYLSQEGVPWQLLNPRSVMPSAGVDREVLRNLLLGSEPERDIEMEEMLMVPPDSVLGALAYFSLPGRAVAVDSMPPLAEDLARLNQALKTGQPQALGGAAAAAIAQRHLAGTAFAGVPLVVRSVAPLPERGRAAARVRLDTAEPIFEQRVSIDLDVTAAGGLLQFDAVLNEEVERSGTVVRDPETGEVVGQENNISFSLSSGDGAQVEQIREAVGVIGYVVILLILLVVLFRRITARSLDARVAMKDAILASVLMMVAMALNAPAFATTMGYTWQLVVFVMLAMLFGGAAVGLLTFVASASSDALARASWPEQIVTLGFARQSAWINKPIGRALVRGAAGAGLLLGVTMLLLVAFPDSPLGGGDETPLLNAEHTFSVFAIAAAQRGWTTLVLVLAVFVGIGSLVKERRAVLVVPVLAAVVAVLGFSFVELPVASIALGLGTTFVIGLTLAVLYRRYDALTLIVSLVLTAVLWDTAEGWLVTASPAFLDALLGGALVVGVLGLGVLGVRSARTGEQIPTYVPDYVVEQRERGRLQRELEIAREVQRSFLPARMPRVAGLDLAAACLAAEEVGGDYYDVIPLDDRRLALVIGDVSGKGIQAAFFMTLAKGFLQTLAHETDSPAEVLRRANRLFCANASRGTFISLIYGVFDLDAQTFTFARAGHNPLILKRSPNQTADFIQPAGLAIGLTPHAVFDQTICEETIALRRGDTLVFYTDGFSEAMDPAKHLYTDERLAEAVAATSASVRAADLLQGLVDDVVGHAGAASQHDDMTMVVVRVGALAETNGITASESTIIADA